MRILLAVIVLVSLPAATAAQSDYGDAPDSLAPCAGIAYPDIGVYGHFPTVRTQSSGACRGARVSYQPVTQDVRLGESVDNDPSSLAVQFPPYDVDECFGDADAGLLAPAAWTITTGGALECGLRVVSCAGGAGGSMGEPCGVADWLLDLTNTSSQFAAFINILVDWNRDGDWCDVVACGERNVPERVIQNFPMVLHGWIELTLVNVPIGPTEGHVWARVTIERMMRGVDWDGSGAGEEGESEDYLLLVGDPSPVAPTTWGALKARYRE